MIQFPSDQTPQNPPQKKKPFIVSYLIALAVVLLLNTLLFPNLYRSRVQDVDYGTFLQMLDDRKLVAVQLEEEEIYFVDGENVTYRTNVIPQDYAIVDRLREAGVKFERVYEKTSILWDIFNYWILPFLPLILLATLAGRRMNRAMSQGLGGPNAMMFGSGGAKQYIVDDQTGITFADVAGQDEAKESLQEIVDFLHNPGKYEAIGAKMPKGALLVGPPGTGKTLLARAVAGEANVPFFSIAGSEFVEMFVGMGASKVRDLFRQADQKAPCIVFIDEIDTIGKKRDTQGIAGNDEREQTLNQLLTEMDGFDTTKGVVILAASNRPETLDPALLRPGRFDRRIPVELPDLRGREEILRLHAHGVQMEQGIDFGVVARMTPGASGAELANIINEAALCAVRSGRSAVCQADLQEAVDTILAGAQKKNAILSEQEKRIVAVHEVGHALVAALQKGSAPVQKITIVPRTSGALGFTMQVDEEERSLMTREELLAKIAVLTAGRAAEELVFGSITTGASNDIEQATRLAHAMVTRYGMTEQFDMVALAERQSLYLGGDSSLTCSDDTAAAVDAAVVELVRTQHQKARDLLAQNRDRLDSISGFLYEKETITGEQFMELLNRS